MKKIVFTLSLLIIFLCCIPAILSAEQSKIAIFDFQKIINESSMGKTTQKQLMNRGNEFQKKLKTEKSKLEAMTKAYEKEKLVLSPEKQREKETEMRNRINDFRRLQNDFEREFKQLELESLNKIQQSVVGIAKEIGEQGKYTLILERKAAGIIYFAKSIDITTRIIKKYNQKAKETN